MLLLVPFCIRLRPPPAFDVCPLDMLRNGREGEPSFHAGMCGEAAERELSCVGGAAEWPCLTSERSRMRSSSLLGVLAFVGRYSKLDGGATLHVRTTKNKRTRSLSRVLTVTWARKRSFRATTFHVVVLSFCVGSPHQTSEQNLSPVEPECFMNLRRQQHARARMFFPVKKRPGAGGGVLCSSTTCDVDLFTVTSCVQRLFGKVVCCEKWL